MSNEKKWDGDLLNRTQEGSFLIDYLISRYEKNKDKTFVLNINAEWGYGKTFFLNNIAKELRDKKYNVIEFDAWKNDYTKEPLLAFMSEINNSLDKFFNKNQRKSKGLLNALKKHSLPLLVSILSKRLTGLTLDELIEMNEEEVENKSSEEQDKQKEKKTDDIENSVSSLTTKLAQYALQEHNTIKDSIEKFKSSMRELLKYINNLDSMELPLFILIDELDRCRPNYSIELLENIKHLFDIEGIVFVIATDSKQLSHSINAVYGESFASEQYLKRFFDQEYNLIKPNNHDYVTSIFDEYNLLDDNVLYSPLEENFYTGKNTKVELFNMFVEFFEINPRDIRQVVIILSTIRLTWKSSNEKLHLVYLLFLIMLKQKSNNLFNNYRDDGNIENIFSDLSLNKNIQIKTNQDINDYSSKSSETRIEELIKTYDNLFDITHEQLSNRIDKIQYSIMKNALNLVEREITRNLRESRKSKIDTKIKKYFELVLHAGQFK